MKGYKTIDKKSETSQNPRPDMLNLYQTIAVEEAIHTCIYCNRIPLTRVRLKSRPANPPNAPHGIDLFDFFFPRLFRHQTNPIRNDVELEECRQTPVDYIILKEM